MRGACFDKLSMTPILAAVFTHQRQPELVEGETQGLASPGEADG
ncbi:MAG: hypothetical protein R3C30_03850 [Hyphomonadaceae bacterium]